MKFSLVLVAKNEEKNAKQFFDALARQTRKPDEVILVDASDDNTAEIAKPFVSQVIPVKDTKGYFSAGYQRNIGVRAASGDVVVFTDLDAEPHPEWFTRLTKMFERPEVQAAVGNITVNNKWGSERGMFADGLKEKSTYAHNCNSAYRRGLLLREPLEEHLYLEDVEYGYRLSLLGIPVYGCPKAKVWHFGPLQKADASLWFMCLRGARAYVRIFLKSPGPSWLARIAYNVFYPLTWLRVRHFLYFFAAIWYALYLELFTVRRTAAGKR